MKISLENLGVLKQAEFELGDLTIVCGNNNTGKTYATYALFGFLHTTLALECIDRLYLNVYDAGAAEGRRAALFRTTGCTRN